MPPRPNRVRLAVCILAILGLPRVVEGQAPRFLNMMGYGALGGGIGAAITADAECPGSGFICIPAEFVIATIGGAVVGMIAGNSIASSANRSVKQGRHAGSGTLAALSVGSALGGAAVGLVAGGVLINDDGSGTFLGSDGQTLLLTALAGAALGIFQLSRRWEALTGGSVGVQPRIGGAGQARVNLTWRF